MTAKSIETGLTSRVIGRPVRHFQEATSTNDLALQLGAEGAPEGFAIFAENQTRGRGRLGRTWQSDRGQSLTFSILLRPPWPDVSRISLVAAVVLARVFQNLTNHPVGIKWPNDIQIQGKKVTGILCESGAGFIVAGIGINVLQEPADFPAEVCDTAGSLAMFANTTPDRAMLAAAILNQFDSVYHSLPGSFPEIIRECAERSVLLEKPIEAELGGRRICGVVAGLAADGGLRIREASGNESVIVAGEVTLLKT